MTSEKGVTSLNLRSWQIRTTLLFSFTYFFFYLCRVNYPIALPFIKAEFQVSAFEIGLIASALTFGYGFGQLINGFLVDRYGARLMMSIGAIMSALANFLMGSSNVLTWAILAWAFNGYFQAMGYPSTCKLISTWFTEDKRGKPLGISEMLQSAASIITIPLSAYIALTFGWRMIFTFPAAILLIMTLIYFPFARDTPKHVGNDDVNFKNTVPILRDMKEKYLKAFASPRLVTAYFSYGFSQFVRYALITWIPIFFYTASGYDLYKAAWISTAFQFGGLVGSPFIGYLNDKYFHTRKWMLISVGMCISGAAGCFIGFVPATNVLLIIAILLICGAAIEALEVAYFLTPIDYLGEEMSATGVGCMNAVGKFTASLQGVVLGFIVDAFGFASAFVTAGLFGLLATILIIPSRKKVNVKQVKVKVGG